MDTLLSLIAQKTYHVCECIGAEVTIAPPSPNHILGASKERKKSPLV